MSIIGEEQVKLASQHVEYLFRDYLTEIDDAYIDSDSEITIAFKVRISPHPQMANETKVKTSIRFTPKATTDSIEDAASEIQGKLPFREDRTGEGAPAGGGGETETHDTQESRPQPNEHGVFEGIPPKFSYASKKAKAAITVVKYKGEWFHAATCEHYQGDNRHLDGLPSFQKKAWPTEREAVDAAVKQLIDFNTFEHGEIFSTSSSHKTQMKEAKKIIAWAQSIISNPSGECRVCHCTDERACPGGCYWVEPDLCSACAGPEYNAIDKTGGGAGGGISSLRTHSPVPNEHGVFAGIKPLYRYEAKKASAAIFVVELPDGWIESFEYNFSLGDHRGAGGLPSLNDPRFPTKELAVNAAAKQIIDDCLPVEHPKQETEAKKMIEWAEQYVVEEST